MSWLCRARIPGRFYIAVVTGFFLTLNVCVAEASTYGIRSPSTDLIGELRVVSARASDTLMDIARTHGVGHREIRLANPDLDIWLPGEGSQVTIPSQYLLPDAPREGIVLNRGEMRLYYFHRALETGEPLVSTYPVGIGRADRQTPIGRGRITMKLHNPAWYPTKEVRADYASRGETLAATVPPGPENPLGEYALMLDIPGYLLHGTNRPDGIGMLVSQGCVRLYPEDIEALVHQVELGTPITIVDQSDKVALVDGMLVVEVHPPVYPREDGHPAGDAEGAEAGQALVRRILGLLMIRGDEMQGQVDWDRVNRVAQRANGMPTVVSDGGPLTGPVAEE